MLTIYIYRHDDGTVQVRCPDTEDFDLVIDTLEEGIRAMTEGEPVVKQ